MVKAYGKHPSPTWAAQEAAFRPRAPAGAATAQLWFPRSPEHRTAAKESALDRRQGRQNQSQALLGLIHHLLDALLAIIGKYLLLIITPCHFHNSEETYNRSGGGGTLQVNRVSKEQMDCIYQTYTYTSSDLQQSSPREKTAGNKKSKTQGSCKKVICLDF